MAMAEVELSLRTDGEGLSDQRACPRSGGCGRGGYAGLVRPHEEQVWWCKRWFVACASDVVRIVRSAEIIPKPPKVAMAWARQ